MSDLASYAEVVDLLNRLPMLLRDARRSRHLSLREAAAQIGVSFATLGRIEAGDDCFLESARVVLLWLDSPDPKSVTRSRAPGRPGRRGIGIGSRSVDNRPDSGSQSRLVRPADS